MTTIMKLWHSLRTVADFAVALVVSLAFGVGVQLLTHDRINLYVAAAVLLTALIVIAKTAKLKLIRLATAKPDVTGAHRYVDDPYYYPATAWVQLGLLAAAASWFFGWRGAVSLGGVGLLALLLGREREVVPRPRPPPKQPIYGKQRFLLLAELIRHGLFRPKDAEPSGVFLGFALDDGAVLRITQRENNPDVLDKPVGKACYENERNLITFGSAGSGKGATAIIPTLLSTQQSTAVFDLKEGQNAAVTIRQRERLGQKVYCINPFGLHTGAPWHLPQHGFNPLLACDPQSPTFVAQINSIAESMLSIQGNEPHFDMRARELCAAIMAHLRTKRPRVPTLPRALLHHEDVNYRKPIDESPTLPAMRGILGLPPDVFTLYMRRLAESKMPVIGDAAGYFTVWDKDVPGIVSSACGQLAFLLDPNIAATLRRDDVDFGELKRRPTSIFATMPLEEGRTYSRFLRLAIQCTCNALSKGGGVKDHSRPVLMLIDEQATLGDMKSIVEGAATLRAAGVQLWSIFQDANQANDLYGKRWESFLGNAGIQQVFQCGDYFTQEYFSKKAGTNTATSQSTNTKTGPGHLDGDGETEAQARVRLIEPDFIQNMKATDSVLFLSGEGYPIYLQRQPYYKIPALRDRALPDPFHHRPGEQS